MEKGGRKNWRKTLNSPKFSRTRATWNPYLQPPSIKSRHSFIILKLPGVKPSSYSSSKHLRTLSLNITGGKGSKTFKLLIYALLIDFVHTYVFMMMFRTILMHRLWGLTQEWTSAIVRARSFVFFVFQFAGCSRPLGGRKLEHKTQSLQHIFCFFSSNFSLFFIFILCLISN